MKTPRREIGDYGENLACIFFKKNHWNILGKNIRLPWNDEIDILAYDENKTLVFVEVKTSTKNFLKPEDQMTRAKIKKCIRAATWYSNQFPELIHEAVGWRIDCVAIRLVGDEPEIQHYKQIV